MTDVFPVVAEATFEKSVSFEMVLLIMYCRLHSDVKDFFNDALFFLFFLVVPLMGPGTDPGHG